MKKLMGVLLVLILSGCDQFAVTPADISGQPIIGHWYFSEVSREGGDEFNQRLYVHVREDGRVLYANLLCRKMGDSGFTNHSTLTLDYMAIKRISTKKMVLQQYPLTPKFELQLGHWPDQGESDNPGDVTFEVDKLPLHRIEAAAAPDFHNWEC